MTSDLRAHREDCPAVYFTDHPERCCCAILAALDATEAKPAPSDPAPAADGGEVEALAEVLSWATGEFTRYSDDAHPDHNRWSWRGDGHGAPTDSNPLRDHFRDAARALLASDWLADLRRTERAEGAREALRVTRLVEADMADAALNAWRSADARRGLSDHDALLAYADTLTRWSERFRMAFDGEDYRTNRAEATR